MPAAQTIIVMIIQIGDTFRKATSPIVAAAISHVHQLVQPFLAMLTAGTSISSLRRWPC